jgi:hypothetical protein
VPLGQPTPATPTSRVTPSSVAAEALSALHVPVVNQLPSTTTPLAPLDLGNSGRLDDRDRFGLNDLTITRPKLDPVLSRFNVHGRGAQA